jgi:hypothetical protein
MVGTGKNVWPNVDIEEGMIKESMITILVLIIYFSVADLYIVLYDSIIANPSNTGHGREGFYFGVNGEHILYDLCKAIGEALVAIGKTDNPEPTTLTKEELDKYEVSNQSSNDLKKQSKSD